MQDKSGNIKISAGHCLMVRKFILQIQNVAILQDKELANSVAMGVDHAIYMSSALAPYHHLGAAADRTFILTTFVSAHSRQLVRPLACLMQSRKAQPLDDTLVADRLGCEPADQCLNLVCHLASAPCLTTMANLWAARKHALPNPTVTG
jgi:hypothetical protein